jgi:DNA polymerase-4
MEPTILHLAIDSFAIHAERLRCPKLAGRPLALAPADSPRPRVLAASREARDAGILPGTPLLVARRLCRDLISLPPDRDLYAGMADSIRDRLLPFAPTVEGTRAVGSASSAGFVLDLTGVARTHAQAKDRAVAAGRDVESAFRLHPTLGLGATRLVTAIAASVLAPDGELLDIAPGAEMPFLAPLSVRVLPSAQDRVAAPRLEILNLRAVGDVQALSPAQLRAAFERRMADALWREARGIDATPRRAVSPTRVAVAEETLGRETNDRRALLARLSRLVIEVCTGLRARSLDADRLAVTVEYADGRHGEARGSLTTPGSSARMLAGAATALFDRAVRRRVRVRRLRIEAWERPSAAMQLGIWDAASACAATSGGGSRRDRAGAMEGALERVRARFGTEALVPATWMAHGLVRTPARP